MKLPLSKWVKIFLVTTFAGLSVLGFMVKLPSAFRHIDKELHAVFYFFAAVFLNLLFTNKKITRHLFIFSILYLFGVSVEYAQEYSNKFFHVKIHGHYDKADIQSNLKGLIAYSILWLIYVVFYWLTKKQTVNKL
jgi:hypothetical protein